jgi:hypothetical protein
LEKWQTKGNYITGTGANTNLLPWGSAELTIPAVSIASRMLEDLLYPILNLRCTADTEAIRDSVTALLTREANSGVMEIT